MRRRTFLAGCRVAALVVAGGNGACGTFGVDEDAPVAPGDDAPVTRVPTPGSTSPDAGANPDVDAAGPPSGTSDAASDALIAAPPTCSLALGTTISFADSYDPIRIGWTRTVAMIPSAAGLVTAHVPDVAAALHCTMVDNAPSLDVGVRITYRVHVTSYPGCCDPVPLLHFGDPSLQVQLTTGYAKRVRVNQLGDTHLLNDFGGYDNDTLLVAAFRRIGTDAWFCGAVKHPGDDVSGTCTSDDLRKYDNFLLPATLQTLDLGLPAGEDDAATISGALTIDAIPE